MEYKNRMGRGIQVRQIKGDRHFTTLFNKLVFIYISILGIILVVLFMTFTSSFQNYFVEYTQNIMLKQARSIMQEYQIASKYSTSKEEAIISIMKRVEIMNEYIQATAWIVDSKGMGYELVSSPDRVPIQVGKNEQKLLEEVFKGNIMTYENGFKEYFSGPVLTVGYPMSVQGVTSGALFIHTPISYIVDTIDTIRKMILKVVILAGSIVFVWIYFIAKQMTRPLKEMNEVAKIIANGGFKARIAVEGKDEIAELGYSLNHMASELDKIEENRKSFIANVSHDLRSPLTSISGFVTAILDGTISAEHQEKYLKIVLSETQRLITMTNAILDLNNMQEEVPIKMLPFNLNLMIEKVALGFEGRCKEKGIHIYTDLDRYCDHVYGQADGINRVIQNLLENAYKFVGENGDIFIKTEKIKNKLWVKVLNNGPPISKDQQELIWERFYKGDTSRGQDKNGLGLGLVIAKEIIKQHHEEIGVRSEENEMVTFFFSLTPVPKKE